MDGTAKPTVASEIVLPLRIVELQDLRTGDGSPVRVRVEFRDRLFVARNFGLPGAGHESAEAPMEDDASRRTRAEALLSASAGIVHSATAFSRPDGSLVRPAFHCDETHAVAGSVPWDMVSLEDKLRVLVSFLELCGFGGTPEERFLSRE